MVGRRPVRNPHHRIHLLAPPRRAPAGPAPEARLPGAMGDDRYGAGTVILESEKLLVYFFPEDSIDYKRGWWYALGHRLWGPFATHAECLADLNERWKGR